MDRTGTLLPRRTVVVTGAGSGIGRACARLLVERGDAVGLVDRDRRALREVADELAHAGERVATAEVDVADGFALREARDDLAARLPGPVDAVVAGAGTMAGGAFAAGVPGEWADMIDSNLTGMLQTAQTFVRDLALAAAEGRSDLVVVGAIAGTAGFPRFAVYSAVEAAVGQLARTLRAELGVQGIRVHQVQPGVTGTRLGSAMSDRAARREWSSLHRDLPPVDPTAVAGAVLFGLDQPPHVTVTDMVVLPTRQDAALPTVQGTPEPAHRRWSLR
ncbi:SDR family oxidoreductase [Cellulomonas endometrii]|uniref:SDR family oxidoreductase n=1 Tax=Cellulomonas endometrii TaxID=3036301 RepID=UPI0024AD58D8|nr:SDR family NAD(P)-dependent oxidoreductase [Cellulomonas endometrii]